MPRSFAPPEPWTSRGWRLKIRDKERKEPPHLTILFKTRAWRFGLRTAAFLDREPDAADVPAPIVAFVKLSLPAIIRAWDEMYPENPVRSQEVSHECQPSWNGCARTSERL